MADKLLKIQDVAEALSVSPITVTRLVKRGELQAPLKIGRAVRWPAAAVQEFLNNAARLAA